MLTLGEDEEARGEESQARNSVGFEMGATPGRWGRDKGEAGGGRGGREK